jgi:hypothetical protein
VLFWEFAAQNETAVYSECRRLAETIATAVAFQMHQQASGDLGAHKDGQVGCGPVFANRTLGSNWLLVSNVFWEGARLAIDLADRSGRAALPFILQWVRHKNGPGIPLGKPSNPE